jgi:DNA-binding SARP family transcriptional activator
MSVRYLVLGPIAVACEGNVVPVPGRRAQALLAALVISAKHVLPSSRLVEAMFGEDWPASPYHALQSQVSRLRKRIGSVIERIDHGYLLNADCDEIDACVFDRSVRAAAMLAANDPPGALAAARGAIELWRGPAFGELADAEPFRLEAMRLEELRITAHELALSAMVATGESEAAVAELRAFLDDQPLRERLWEALIVGLVQVERRAEALDALAQYGRLMDDLGLPPAPSLVELGVRIHSHASPVD